MIKITSKEDIEKASDIFFNMLKSEVKVYKVPEMLTYTRTIGEPHHILGSYGNLKSTDLLLLPLTRKDHIKVESNKSLTAILNLPSSINHLQEFTVNILNRLRNYEKII